MSSREELKILSEYAPYHLEIINYWKQKETECTQYYSRSCQLHYRLYVIRLIRSASRHLKLSMVAIHLAVHLFDYLIDYYNNIKCSKLSLVALVCISLSAKFEGLSDTASNISQLSAFQLSRCSKKEFLFLELKAFKFFNMNLSIPTTAHFVEIYRWLSVLEQDCLSNESFNLKEIAYSKIIDLLDIMLDDHRINTFRPSLLAACVIYITRQLLKLTPEWPFVLQYITGYNVANLSACYQILISLYKIHCHNQESSNYTEEGSIEENNLEQCDNRNVASEKNCSCVNTVDCDYYSHSSCLLNEIN